MLDLSALKQESSTVKANRAQQAEERKRTLEALKTQYLYAFSLASDRLNTLKTQADRRTQFTVGTSLAGIASGLTATVLLVASPANAVWASGFAGFSTGVLGFQSQMYEEGYSRQTIARIYEATMNKMVAAYEEYGTNYSALEKGIDDLEPDKWNEHLSLASGAIVKLHAASVFVPLPMGAAEDIAELKKSNAELKKRLEDISAQIRNAKPPEASK